MNAMERVLKTLNHEEADRVPVYPVLGGCTRQYTGASYPEWSTNADICAESFLKAREDLDLDCIVTLIDLSVEADAWGQPIIFPENDAAHPDYKKCVVADIEEYEKIKKVDYRTSKRMMMHIDVVKKIKAEAKGEFPVVAFVFGPLGTLSMLRNQQAMYMDFYDDPDAVYEAAEQIKETLKEYSLALLEAGADGIMFDTLFSSGSIMRKDMWEEMEGELVKDLADTVHQHGGLVMIHNCGDKIYVGSQIEAMHPDAISLLYTADDCKDFKEMKEKYGDKTTFIGCVEPAKAVIGTDEDWAEACRQNIDDMAKNGGFILATGCEYPSGASFDRAKQMVEIAKTYGKY